MAGDVTALAELIARVQVGWRVDAFSHGCNEGVSAGTITRLSDSVHGSGKAGFIRTQDKPTRSQGRTFTHAHFTWPVEGDDFEIEGATLREYSYSAYTGGRALSLAITFSAPTD